MNGLSIFPLDAKLEPAIAGWTRGMASDVEPSDLGIPDGGLFGVLTTGLLVIDLDVNHDSGHDGYASWKSYGCVDSKHVTKSKRGGEHHWWRLPDDADPSEYRQLTGVLGNGIDVKSYCNLVRESDLPFSLDELDVAPQTLLNDVRRASTSRTTVERSDAPRAAEMPPYVLAALDGIAEDLRTFKDGQGHYAQVRAAHRLVGLSNNPASGLDLELAHGVYLDNHRRPDEKTHQAWDYTVGRLRDSMDLLPEQADPVASDDEEQDIYGDVSAYLNGTLAPLPTLGLLHRTDGVGVFYPGKDNWLIGDPECGKTWIAAAGLAQTLIDGGTGIFIDLDHNSMQVIVDRLQRLGVPADMLCDRSRFRYVEPEDAQVIERVVSDCLEWKPNIAVIDSVGELVPMLGRESNSNDDFTNVHRVTGAAMMRGGTAVIYIDHLPKNADAKKAGAIGAGAKRRAMRGAAYRVEVIESYIPGQGGASSLRVHKDAIGTAKEHSTKDNNAELFFGVFRLDSSDPERLSYRVYASKDAHKGDVDRDEAVQAIPQLREAAATNDWADDYVPSISTIKTLCSVGQAKALLIQTAYRKALRDSSVLAA